MKLSVNVTTPLAVEKFVTKTGKCNQYELLLVLLKSSWGTFKTIFETLHITGGVVYTKPMTFEAF